jgi:hypothetical protein
MEISDTDRAKHIYVPGGTTGLSYSGVPEPGSLARFGSGILLLACLLRRKLS